MRISIRYFAGHRDITGTREEQLDLAEGLTVADLWDALIERYPRLAPYRGRMLYSVNEDFGTLATVLHDGDEIAFIPPVSGGMR